MKIRVGDRIQCTKNTNETFWFEFQVGKIYEVKQGRNYPCCINGKGLFDRWFHIDDAENFFERYGTHGELGESLDFKLLSRCTTEEFE